MVRSVTDSPKPLSPGADAPIPQAPHEKTVEQKSAQQVDERKGAAGTQGSERAAEVEVALITDSLVSGGTSVPKSGPRQADQPKSDGLAANAAKLDALKEKITADSRNRTMASEVTLSLDGLRTANDPRFPADFAMRLVTLSNAVQSGDIVVEPGVAQLLEETSRAAVLKSDLHADGARDAKATDKRTARLAEVIRYMNELYKPNGPLDLRLQAAARATVAQRAEQLKKKTEALRQKGGAAENEPLDVLDMLAPGPSDDVKVPSPELVKIEKAWRSVEKDFGDMDVVAVAQIVLFECAKGHEQDLKDLLAEMQKLNAQKKLMRDQINHAKAERARMDAEIRAEYNARTNLDPKNTLYVDPSRVSFEDYRAGREVATNAAEMRNDPGKVAAVLALTNNLVVYPRPEQDFGPPPTYDGLNDRAADGKNDVKEQHDTDVETWKGAITSLTAQWGFKDENETKAIISVAASLGISNESGLDLYKLWKLAGGAGTLADFVSGGGDAKLGLAPGAGPGATQAAVNRVAGAIIDAAKKKDLSPEQRAAIVERLDKKYGLMVLQQTPGDFDGKASIPDKINALDEEIRKLAKDWNLTGPQQETVNELARTEHDDFARRLQEAVDQDVGNISGTLPHNAKGDFDRGAVEGFVDNMRSGGSCDVNGNEQIAYFGVKQVDKDQEWIDDKSKRDMKANCTSLNVKLCSNSQVGALLAPAASVLGMDGPAFDRAVKNGGLKDAFTICVGTVMWRQGELWWDSRWFHVRMFGETGGGQDGTFTNPNTDFGHTVNGLKGRLGVPGKGDAILTPPPPPLDAPPTIGERAKDAVGATEPPDPSVLGVTFDPALDELLAPLAKGPFTAEQMKALFEKLYARYPENRKSFDTFVSFIFVKLNENKRYPAANYGALRHELGKMFDERMRFQQEVIDKDNRASFQSRPEPDAKLHKGTMAVFDAVIEELQGQMDTLNDLTQEMQMKLQLALDRRAKMYETLSNIIKKAGQTGDNIIANMK